MIPHSTQGSYWWWRCGTFKFKILSCLVVLSWQPPWSRMIHKGERKWASDGRGSKNHSYTKYSVSNHCQRVTKWGVVGWMLKLWEDKWVIETENEFRHDWLQVDNKISPNESILQKCIHVMRELLINNYSGINRYIYIYGVKYCEPPILSTKNWYMSCQKLKDIIYWQSKKNPFFGNEYTWLVN
jgi:hypothetical protein